MNMDVLNRAWDVVRAHMTACEPLAAVTLGSGWGVGADGFTVRDALPYSEIPGMGAPTVGGHAGRLLWGAGVAGDILVFDGRRHWYEGLGWEPIAIPVYLAARFGARALILTNAAGGIGADRAPGDVMAIDDHVNLLGANPLAGPHDPAWGPRFPDMTAVYDAQLRALFDRAAEGAGLALRHGVYAALTGPSYETPAEVRALAALGVDAVGMSTVPEAILGHAAGLRVGALSLVTNAAAGQGPAPDHDMVLDCAARRAADLRTLLGRILDLLPALPPKDTP
jgi:purine-nucleoside phosphorylase